MKHTRPIRRHDISFRRDGLINISSRIVKALHIEPGDHVRIIFDRYECWLCRDNSSKSTPEKLARCSLATGKSSYMRAWSVKICDEMLSKCGGDRDSVKFRCGEKATIQGLDAVCVIYKNIL